MEIFIFEKQNTLYTFIGIVFVAVFLMSIAFLFEGIIGLWIAIVSYSYMIGIVVIAFPEWIQESTNYKNLRILYNFAKDKKIIKVGYRRYKIKGLRNLDFFSNYDNIEIYRKNKSIFIQSKSPLTNALFYKIDRMLPLYDNRKKY